jgi:hypothetical protein
MNKVTLIRQVLLLLGSAVILLAVGVAAYLVLPNVAASPPATPTNPGLGAVIPSIQPGWLVYTDPDGALSFSYPADAHVEADSNAIHPFQFIRVVFKDPAQASLIVDIRANRAKGTPAQFAAQFYQESASAPAPKALLDGEQKVRAGSAQAAKYIIPPTLTDFMLFVPRADKMVVIYPGRNDELTSAKTPGVELFNTVLGTFIFSGNE